jgi:hypothetical protein
MCCRVTRDCSPIALFVYARLDHMRRTIEALKRNRLAAESDLIVFSDGPKRQEVAALVQEVRRYIRNIDGFKSVRIIERERNLGLAASIIDGVTCICDMHGRVIVIEDDLITSPHFLTYMNDALDKYADTQQVAAVSGFHPPFKAQLPETFFQCDAECWGWATWKRAWEKFNPNGAELLAELKRRGLLKTFNQDNTYPYVRMLKDQIEGRNDSWAIRWRATVILNGMLSLYPDRSLVCNIGLDGSGTHGGAMAMRSATFNERPVSVRSIPLVHSDLAFREFARFNGRHGFKGGLVNKLRRFASGLRS